MASFFNCLTHLAQPDDQELSNGTASKCKHDQDDNDYQKSNDKPVTTGSVAANARDNGTKKKQKTDVQPVNDSKESVGLRLLHGLFLFY